MESFANDIQAYTDTCVIINDTTLIWNITFWVYLLQEQRLGSKKGHVGTVLYRPRLCASSDTSGEPAWVQECMEPANKADSDAPCHDTLWTSPLIFIMPLPTGLIQPRVGHYWRDLRDKTNGTGRHSFVSSERFSLLGKTLHERP